MRLRGIIFDMDGTVVEVPYNWSQIKKDLNTQRQPILSYLQQLEEPEKTKKWRILEKYEKEATQKAVLKEGIDDFLEFLTRKGIKKALVTNNSWKNVCYLLRKFNLEFDWVVSRDSGLWKPSAFPFLDVLEKFSISQHECCVVGDSHYDLKAAEEAGIHCVFILTQEKEKFSSSNVQVVGTVKELKNRIKNLLN